VFPLSVLGSLAAVAKYLSVAQPSGIIDWIGMGLTAFFVGIIGFASTAVATAAAATTIGTLVPRLRPTDRRLRRFEVALGEYGAVQRSRIAAERKRLDAEVRLEHELGELYRQLGYEVIVTKGSGDDGVDLILVRDGLTTVVQCKAHAKPVGPAVVRELWGAMHAHGAQRCILASLGGFTRGVVRFADGKAVELVDLDGVVALQRQARRTAA
jgi:hypothetical protein